MAYPLIWLVLWRKNYLQAIRSDYTEAQILIHASSLGEINAVAELIKALQDRGYKLAINTVTVTGRERAKQLFPELPISLSALDIGHLRKIQMRKIKPQLILIAETEIWPNMLYAAKINAIPVIFVNARISEKSLKSFLKARSLIAFLSSSVRLILAQSEDDNRRLASLFPGKCLTAGNLKYALKLPEHDSQQLRMKWGYREDDLILCWGSSRPGEEELLLKILPRLLAEFPRLKLILAPRHPKRISEVSALLTGSEYQMFSQEQPETRAGILVIDVLGRLTEAYAICDLAIVGGSFMDFGGHNPLEPAFYAKAIIIGRYYSSCRDSVKQLLSDHAILISESRTLQEDILALLCDKALRDSMGQAARKVLTKNAHALENHIREIEQCLK